MRRSNRDVLVIAGLAGAVVGTVVGVGVVLCKMLWMLTFGLLCFKKRGNRYY